MTTTGAHKTMDTKGAKADGKMHSKHDAYQTTREREMKQKVMIQLESKSSIKLG